MLKVRNTAASDCVFSLIAIKTRTFGNTVNGINSDALAVVFVKNNLDVDVLKVFKINLS